MKTLSSTRFEYKYKMSKGLYLRTLNALIPYCHYDKNSQNAATKRYLVRSLYYDCQNYSAYTQKMEGIYQRNKYRIRSYEKMKKDASIIKVEVKSRSGYLIHKLSDVISVEDYDAFIATGMWGDKVGSALDEFIYNYHKFNLRPTVLVEYQREALYSTMNPTLRFSFDHDIRYVWTDDLFAENSEMRPCTSNNVIFEIKSDSNNIEWLSEIIQDLNLVTEPNSKYANAFERTATDIWL